MSDPSRSQPRTPIPDLGSGPSSDLVSDLVSDLGARRLLIVSGKGGVGRTTTAALLGATLAARGRKILVATTGLDDRLAWMLGVGALTNAAVEVSPGLSIQRLHPPTCIEEYGALITRSQRLSHAVFSNRAVRRLMQALPGLDDFAVLGKIWHEACRALHYDTVIFDGPASGHLRLVLGVPQALVETVAEGPLTREARAIREALRDPGQSAAVLVGLPEAWPLTELAELAESLRGEIGMHVGALVLNKVWPGDLPNRPEPGPPGPEPAPRSGAPAQPEIDAVLAVVSEIAAVGQTQRETVQTWLEGHPRAREQAVLSVPWRPQGLDGRHHLDALAAALSRWPQEAVA